jgi:GNAT superfamily N-acetyltransferase
MAAPTQLVLRTAGAEDATAVAALVNQAFSIERFFIEGERTSPDEVRALMRVGEFLLFENAAALAAVVYLELRGERGYFGMLSVDPAHQKQGLGRRLVETAEQRSREAGCRIMEIQTVNLRLELPPYYRRLGYVECGTAPFTQSASERLTQPCHFIKMQKPL